MGDTGHYWMSRKYYSSVTHDDPNFAWHRHVAVGCGRNATTWMCCYSCATKAADPRLPLIEDGAWSWRLRRWCRSVALGKRPILFVPPCMAADSEYEGCRMRGGMGESAECAESPNLPLISNASTVMAGPSALPSATQHVHVPMLVVERTWILKQIPHLLHSIAEKGRLS